ncbi:hypothetical protein TruAng_007555 [Truncatella angustata]|nr:hypothetical protein TruAng_007555 [Truncatella angustata]
MLAKSKPQNYRYHFEEPIGTGAVNTGMILAKATIRRSACKICIRRRYKKIESFSFLILQNDLSPVFEDHKIRAPLGKPKYNAETVGDSRKLKLESKTEGSILHHFKLKPEDTTEQCLASAFIIGSNKDYFQWLLV